MEEKVEEEEEEEETFAVKISRFFHLPSSNVKFFGMNGEESRREIASSFRSSYDKIPWNWSSVSAFLCSFYRSSLDFQEMSMLSSQT